MPDEKICPLLTIAKSAIVAHRKGDGDMVQNCVEEKCAWWGGDCCAIPSISNYLYAILKQQ